MTEFQSKMNDFVLNDRPKTSIKFKGHEPSEYYITSPDKKIYAWPAKYLLSHKVERDQMLSEHKIPNYFIEITEDNCEILDDITNPKLI